MNPSCRARATLAARARCPSAGPAAATALGAVERSMRQKIFPWLRPELDYIGDSGTPTARDGFET
jgi:hypothetical protein